ncbi:hypothetical protein [Streptomyces cinereoruber]|uniref:hypothetical protein n=1 Tax=Streptomyces cinereoruber TaxID=67260 RepID=UPI003C2E27CB
MRDHDTAERAAQAAPYGTDKQTTEQTDTRPGTADRGEADDRRETDGRLPAPVERGPGPAEKSAPPGRSDVRPAPLAKATGHGDDEHVPDLLGKADGDAYRERWREIQGRFVDDPREAVHSADELVADVMKTLAEAFADHKHTLEGQWSEGRDADTEDLRVALREYRSFFNRLLTTSAPQR